MDSQGPKGRGGTFRALADRNFRLFYAGQGISLVGTFLQQVALGWFVYGTTGSKAMLGTIAFASQIPSLVLAPLAGGLADRWDRKRTLVVVQSLSGLQALVLAVLVTTGNAPPWLLVVLAAALGCLNAFDIPFRQSFVSQMLGDPSLLPNAIALNSALFNGARLVGPAVGGVMVAAVGEGNCFYVNAASYIAVVAALLAIRPHPLERHPHHRLGREILDGVEYVRGHAPIRDLLLLVALVGGLGMSYTVLMPAVARDNLHGDATTLGFLMGSGGAGAMVAALILASRRSVKGLLVRIAGMALLSGTALIGFALSTAAWLDMVLIALTAFGLVGSSSGANALIQTLVDNRFRGRVMSLYTLAFMGSSTFGSLLIGWISERRGFTEAMLGYGVAFLLGAIVFSARVPALRAELRDRLARAASGQE